MRARKEKATKVSKRLVSRLDIDLVAITVKSRTIESLSAPHRCRKRGQTDSVEPIGVQE
jgi:hypothetical protein